MKNKRIKDILNFSKGTNSNYISPLVLIIALVLVLGSLLFVINRNSVIKQNQDIELLADRCAKTIEFKLKGNLDYLKLIASKRAEGNLSETNFQFRISAYLKDHSEFINITWIDSTYTIKTVSPLKGNSHIIGLKVELEEPKRASRLARQKKQAIYTKPFEAIQSGSSFEVWIPIFVDDNFIGLFAGVYSCDRLLKNSLQLDQYDRTYFSLLNNEPLHVSNDSPISKKNKTIIYQQELNSLKNGLKLQIQSSKLNSFDSTMRILIGLCVLLIIGLLYSLWVNNIVNKLRKRTQNSLIQNKDLLKKQNKELIQAIKKAEESEILFKSMTDTSPLAIYMSSGLDQKAEYINPSFTKLFGYTLEEVPTVSEWWPLAYPDEIYRNLLIEKWQNEVEIAIKNNSQIDPIEANVTCKDGTEKVISWGFVSTGVQNWAFGLDLTKSRRAQEELLVAKEQAEESDRLKTAFLANMSHEIRTPMNGILGFAELLKSKDLTGKKQSEYIDIIEKSGFRMLNIINDIISISKIEAGLMDLNIVESNINKQLEYIHTFFKPEVETKDLQFNFKNQLLDNEADIITDREKVYAVLTNLVKNAIKFTKIGFIEIGCKRQNDFIEFYVKDTGMGIHTEMQKKIFKRFIQADLNDKNAYQGAGLGLAISKSYIEMLGGKLWVKSEFGVGSTFYFTLPFQPNNTINSLTNNEFYKKTVMDKLKILIVEDDEASRQLISIVVEEFSSETICMEDGQEAVNICREIPDIDLILMDIQMPIMNGYLATNEIRKFNKEVVIIAQTAYALEGDREKAIDAGCNDYITKPIKKDLLNKLIVKHLS